MPLTVAALWRYPLKSGRGEALAEAVVARRGIAGDREWMVVGEDGEAVTAREVPRLLLVGAELHGDGLRLDIPGAGEVLATPRMARASATVHHGAALDVATAGGEADERLSAFLGRPVRLVHADRGMHRALNPAFSRPEDTTGFADAYPLLMTTEPSLVRLNAWIAEGPHPAEGPLDPRRFRPNVVIAGGEPFAEDGWRVLRIGDAVLRAPKGCDRCVMTTTDPDTAARGREPIATLARHRRWDGKTWFGMNLVPDTIGVTIRVGDPVEVLATAASDGPPRAGVA